MWCVMERKRVVYRERNVKKSGGGSTKIIFLYIFFYLLSIINNLHDSIAVR